MLVRWLPERWKQAIRRRTGVLLMEDRLRNLAKAGFRPAKIIDAGAHRGDWTRVAKTVFPEAEILMIEPLPECREELRQIESLFRDVHLRPALLAATAGTARFCIEGTNSRVLYPGETTPVGARVVESPAETLWDAARHGGFAGCDLLKMDLQGHELEALAGAGPIFGGSEVIFMEVSWIRIGNVPLLNEVLGQMAEKNYVPYDVMNLNYRPRDRALWQSDFVFVKKSSSLLASRDWA